MKKLSLFVFPTILAFSISLARAEDKVKVGVMLHLGGDFAAWGEAYLQGVTLAEESVNSAGGIKGKQLSLVIEDTRFDPRLTAVASKKLLNVDHVSAAVISTFTEVQVAGPMFEQSKVPLVVIGDSDASIDDMGSYVFSTGAWVSGFAVTASRYFHDHLHLKNIAILATNNPWSQTTAETFKRDFEAQGGTIVFREDVNPDNSDFRTVLGKIKALNADGVFAPITASPAAFFQQARQLKLSMPIATAGGALDGDVIAAAPEATEGRYVTNSFFDGSRPEAKKLLSLYRGKYHKEPQYPSVTARGYDGFQTVIQAMQSASSLSPEAIKEALYHVDFDGAGFHVHMSAEGGARLPVDMLEVRHGELEKAE